MKTFITRLKTMNAHPEFRVYVIESSAIKRFFFLEIILGTIVYNLALYLSHNALLAGVGSWAGTESVKRLPVVFKRLAFA